MHPPPPPAATGRQERCPSQPPCGDQRAQRGRYRPPAAFHDGDQHDDEAEHEERVPDPLAPPGHVWLMRLAAAAAPNPLSILTTVTPEAQELSMPSRAASPPNDAPYPTLVGTAITGTFTRPPTTLGSAPSIPATTIMTAALRRASVWLRIRCRPATPTSVRRSTRLRSARAVTAASSATARSLVPAVTTRMVPRPVGAGSGSGGRYTVRPSSFTSARGKRATSASRWDGSTRVARNVPQPSPPAPARSRRSAIATTWAGVLP